MGGYKSAATREFNKMRDTPGKTIWQRSYHDRIIRNDRELDAIRQYIVDNPVNWLEDEEYMGKRS